MNDFLKSPISGYAACFTIIFVWSFWLIISRLAAASPLTVYDLAAMRYGFSAIVSLPFVLYFKPWKSMSIIRIISLSFLLGPVYILTVFSGFSYAPAAHGGIFMNGLLPIFTILIGILFFSAKLDQIKIMGAVVILCCAGVLGTTSQGLDLSQSWVGDLCFAIGGAFFAVYVTLSRQWAIKTVEILFCGSIVNVVIYLPIWYFLLPSGLSSAETSDIILQGVYQGLLPNLVGLILIAHASRTIGSDATSAIMAIVPATTAILGVWLLDEYLGMISWLAIFGLTGGFLVITLPKPHRIQEQ
jgi:drug/metabolite transporter (DMT)-like permease